MTHVFFPLWVQLLNHHVVTELMLIDVLMNNMMERISDPSCAVRMLAVRGLGNIAVGSPEKVGILPAPTFSWSPLASSLHLFLLLLTSFCHQVNKYAKELLAAMSSGMEEKDDPGQPTAQSYCVKDRRKVAAIFCVAKLIYICNSL